MDDSKTDRVHYGGVILDATPAAREIQLVGFLPKFNHGGNLIAPAVLALMHARRFMLCTGRTYSWRRPSGDLIWTLAPHDFDALIRERDRPRA